MVRETSTDWSIAKLVVEEIWEEWKDFMALLFGAATIYVNEVYYWF